MAQLIAKPHSAFFVIQLLLHITCWFRTFSLAGIATTAEVPSFLVDLSSKANSHLDFL